MNSGVPQTYESPLGDCLATPRRPFMRAGGNSSRVGFILLGSLSTLIFASSALGETATGRSGSAHHGVAPACKGHGGGGKNTPVVPIAPVEPTPPVVEPKPPTGPTPPVNPVPPVGGGNTVVETTTPIAAAAAPVAPPSTTTAKPLLVPKTTLKQPARKAAKRHPKKHRARAGARERTFARSALPNKRAAFTG
jgi:hypothetical protein